MRTVTVFFFFAVLVSSAFGMAARPAVDLASKDNLITVFFTGSELGILKPCGCSGAQLGGIEKRPAIFDTAAKSQRMIVDTGRITAGDGEQDLIKFGIVMQAYNLLDYDFVNLTRLDLQVAKDEGILNNPVLEFISAYGEQEKISSMGQKKFSLDGRVVVVNIISVGVKFTAEGTKIPSFPKDSGNINILILDNYDQQAVKAVSNMDKVDIVVCPPQSDEPMLVSQTGSEPLFFSVGRYGKYIARLQIKYNQSTNKHEFEFTSVPVVETLTEDETLVDLYKTYQLLVKEADFLSTQPRFLLENGLEYMGSDICRMCHKYEYGKWSRKRHSNAFATLEKVGSDFDPECVGCHVIGLDYHSGFVTAEKTPSLKDVGCENCHGPGSKHVETIGEAPTVEPKSNCIDCHTPEHSVDYSGNEDVYLEKMIHWKEQTIVGDVKKIDSDE